MRSPRRLAAAASALLACAAVLTAPTATAPAGAAQIGDVFRAATVWQGQFASPTVLKVGQTYWAYSTVTGGDNLPAMSSTDLTTWRVRDAYPEGANPGWWSGYNDAMPHPAKWAYYGVYRNGMHFTAPWAPSVGLVNGRYIAAYSVPVNAAGRRCISVASSSRPDGQFVDTSSGPIVCSSDPRGTIDPQVFTPGNGKAYLVWKNAGVPGSSPTKIWIRQLDATGLALQPGTHAHFLLQTAQSWEGNVVENPAMVYFGSRYYLFYSGNTYTTSRYATGYAICRSVFGPCRRPQRSPILGNGGGLYGSGGATPFVGPSGALRLAYHAWDAGRVAGGELRKLHIALLSATATGRLQLVSRG